MANRKKRKSRHKKEVVSEPRPGRLLWMGVCICVCLFIGVALWQSVNRGNGGEVAEVTAADSIDESRDLGPTKQIGDRVAPAVESSPAGNSTNESTAGAAAPQLPRRDADASRPPPRLRRRDRLAKASLSKTSLAKAEARSRDATRAIQQGKLSFSESPLWAPVTGDPKARYWWGEFQAS